MWFLGLLAGAVVGGVLGHGAGALAGAVLGAIAGAAYRSAHPVEQRGGVQARLAELERKVDHIYKALEDIHWRLRRLEQPGRIWRATRPMCPPNWKAPTRA